MSLLKKTIGFIAVLGVLPAAFAVTARPSVIGTASRRMPTMSTVISSGSTSTSGSVSNLLANAECIDAYTACMKGGDACGSNFEECTTKVLFHGKMPQCLSTLAQCSSSGVSSLFGTSNTTALSNVASKNTYGEVTDYTYPTDGSVLGQLIVGAAISNKYDTSNCVKRYTSCLKKTVFAATILNYAQQIQNSKSKWFIVIQRWRVAKAKAKLNYSVLRQQQLRRLPPVALVK